MSQLSARFFTYVQGAAFYRELHDRAVRLLPIGAGNVWFDVGCGPGLVARLAATHGYKATGFDIDSAMVGQARKIARYESSPTDYEVTGVDELLASGRKVNVVSAASLLAVLNDKEGALIQLMSCLTNDGTLLVIETTELMKPRAAWMWLKKNGYGKRNWILLLWAWTRAHGLAIRPTDMRLPGYRIEHVDVFEGLVSAWLVRREARATG